MGVHLFCLCLSLLFVSLPREAAGRAKRDVSCAYCDRGFDECKKQNLKMPEGSSCESVRELCKSFCLLNPDMPVIDIRKKRLSLPAVPCPSCDDAFAQCQKTGIVSMAAGEQDCQTALDKCKTICKN